MLSSRLRSSAFAWRGLVTRRQVTTGCWPGMTRTKSKMNSSAVWTISAPFVGRPRAVSLSISNFRGCFTPLRLAARRAPRPELPEVEARPADVARRADSNHQQPVASGQGLDEERLHVLVEDGEVRLGGVGSRGRRLARRRGLVRLALRGRAPGRPAQGVQERGEGLAGGERARHGALHALEEGRAFARRGHDLA